MLAVQWHPEELNDIALLQNIFRVRDNVADLLALAGEI